MPMPIQGLPTLLGAAPSPSTPLGPLRDGAIAWTTWATLMSFVGVLALALLGAGPVAVRHGQHSLESVTARLARVAVIAGMLSIPAVLTDLAHDADEAGGYDYGAAWSTLFDGTNDGRLSGIEVTMLALGVLLVLPLILRSRAAGRARRWQLAGGLLAGAVALGTTKFPDAVPKDWGRTSFQTLMWLLHLLGGGVWIGGLIGLVAIALPGALAGTDRSAFWSPVIRRFSVMAMSCVGAIALSGLWLYWEHVDGPTQLFTTMYGRVLGVKILIFGTMLLLGMVNQFWLHPRIDALRATGEDRRLPILLARQFPAVVAVEVLLGLGVLLVAPFLHGSARNQAFQEQAAKHATSETKKLPRIAVKQVSTSTWVYGTGETVAVVVIMAAAYRASGRISKRRQASGQARQPDAKATAAAPG